MAAVADVLPLAFGVALSPGPIIAAVLMLLSPRARGTSVGFLLGWVVGILVAVSAFTALSSVLTGNGDEESRPVVAVVKLVLGAALLLLGVRQWMRRPKAGEAATTPGWMAAVATMTPAKGLGLGLLLSVANPKNLLMGVAAGLSIGSARLAGAGVVAPILVYTVVAAITVAVPVLAYLVAPGAMAGPLDKVRGWLVQHSAVLTSGLLVVLGLVLVAKGAAGL